MMYFGIIAIKRLFGPIVFNIVVIYMLVPLLKSSSGKHVVTEILQISVLLSKEFFLNIKLRSFIIILGLLVL
jgi:hypothetical protein